jgi:hypothetical protein
MKKKIKVTKSSGNVFADIGIPNAAEHSIKADLVLGIAALMAQEVYPNREGPP